MSVEIRQATSDDAADLARLLSPLGYEVTTEQIRERWLRFTEEGNAALLALVDGRVVGAVTLHRATVLHRAAPVGRITALAVEEGAQRRGVGRTLLHAAEDCFRAMGCGMIEVTSHRRRQQAHSFYEHMGYERTSHRFARSLDDPEPLPGDPNA